MSKGTLSYYEFTEEELVQKMNVAKDMILETLANDGYIKDDIDPHKLAGYYFIDVITKKKITGALTKFFNINKDDSGKFAVLRTSSTMPGMEGETNE